MGFYNKEELKQLGFSKVGKNVLLSRKASFYSPEKISIGSNVRIDDFCILSGEITIGNYVHIGAYSALYGGSGIFMDDFSGLSSRVTIYSESDDYSGNTLTNPTIPDEYKKTVRKKVVIGKHAIVGASAVVLPSVIIAEGTAIGALCLVTKSTLPWKVYFGSPAKIIKDRKTNLLELEQEFIKTTGGGCHLKGKRSFGKFFSFKIANVALLRNNEVLL